jgi:hypothetical protein
MIHISVRHDFDRLSRTLDNFSKKQLPFAAARALTTVARDAGDDFTRSLPQKLDRPTPFTRKAIGIVSARKNNLRAVVLIKDRQASYLRYQEEGGRRDPKRKALAMPVGMRLNQYGNMANKAIARLVGQPNVFVGTVNGVGGIWRRPPRGTRRDGTYGTVGADKGLKLLAAFRPHATYMPRLGFGETVGLSVKQHFSRRMREALVQALKTARR